MSVTACIQQLMGQISKLASQVATTKKKKDNVMNDFLCNSERLPSCAHLPALLPDRFLFLFLSFLQPLTLSALLLRPETCPIKLLCLGLHPLFAQISSPHCGFLLVKPGLPRCSAQPAVCWILHVSPTLLCSKIIVQLLSN